MLNMNLRFQTRASVCKRGSGRRLSVRRGKVALSLRQRIASVDLSLDEGASEGYKKLARPR